MNSEDPLPFGRNILEAVRIRYPGLRKSDRKDRRRAAGEPAAADERDRRRNRRACRSEPAHGDPLFCSAIGCEGFQGNPRLRPAAEPRPRAGGGGPGAKGWGGGGGGGGRHPFRHHGRRTLAQEVALTNDLRLNAEFPDWALPRARRGTGVRGGGPDRGGEPSSGSSRLRRLGHRGAGPASQEFPALRGIPCNATDGQPPAAMAAMMKRPGSVAVAALPTPAAPVRSSNWPASPADFTRAPHRVIRDHRARRRRRGGLFRRCSERGARTTPTSFTPTTSRIAAVTVVRHSCRRGGPKGWDRPTTSGGADMKRFLSHIAAATEAF